MECKKWSSNHYRLSALRSAVKKHKERVEFYKKLTNENAIPIIVTLIEEEILLCEDIPIIPIFRLNSFINEEDSGQSSPHVADDDAISAMQVKTGALEKQTCFAQIHGENLLAKTKRFCQRCNRY